MKLYIEAEVQRRPDKDGCYECGLAKTIRGGHYWSHGPVKLKAKDVQAAETEAADQLVKFVRALGVTKDEVNVQLSVMDF